MNLNNFQWRQCGPFSCDISSWEFLFHFRELTVGVFNIMEGRKTSYLSHWPLNMLNSKFDIRYIRNLAFTHIQGPKRHEVFSCPLTNVKTVRFPHSRLVHGPIRKSPDTPSQLVKERSFTSEHLWRKYHLMLTPQHIVNTAAYGKSMPWIGQRSFYYTLYISLAINLYTWIAYWYVPTQRYLVWMREG